jgi:uncharacterized protein (DUF362 family)/Pyruvate/2-oxoacid:ferredoxin oxidoreductase delta subunit
MAKVVARRTSYVYEELRECFFAIMEAIGGAEIGRGCSVLVKPNLLCPAKPAEGILTHPMLVRAAVEYVLERGGSPLVADSPAMGSFKRIVRESGIEEALKGLPVVCKPLNVSVPVDIGKPFGLIEMAEDSIASDMVINLPKLKTHSQMLLTLGVKNLFGCVVGYRKPEWHMRTGVDTAMFARLLVLIYERIRPKFTILDGVLAMEGEGPGKGGKPRWTGLLMGGDNAHAIDAAVCRMLGISQEVLLTVKTARELNIWDGGLEIEGELPLIEDFDLPGRGSLIFGPKILHGFIRRQLTGRPVVDTSRCQLCGECWKICPAKAIGHDRTSLNIDYGQCIRCYCCLEVCPYGAIHKGETVTGRMVRGIAEKIL